MKKADCAIFWEYLKRIDPCRFMDREDFYRTFPVREMSFEDWWKEREGPQTPIPEWEDDPVTDCLRLLKLRLYTYARSIHQEAREPTFDEIIGRIERIMTEQPEMFYVVADLTYETKEIQRSFAKKIRKRRTEENISSKKLLFSGKLRFSTKSLRHEELKRFLRAYDLETKGMRTKEIARTIGYGHQDSSSSVRKDINKAKRIFDNIVGLGHAHYNGGTGTAIDAGADEPGAAKRVRALIDPAEREKVCRNCGKPCKTVTGRISHEKDCMPVTMGDTGLGGTISWAEGASFNDAKEGGPEHRRINHEFPGMYDYTQRSRKPKAISSTRPSKG